MRPARPDRAHAGRDLSHMILPQRHTARAGVATLAMPRRRDEFEDACALPVSDESRTLEAEGATDKMRATNQTGAGVQTGAPGRSGAPVETGYPRREIARGFRYAHFRANANTSELLKVASAINATLEMLYEKGLIGAEELERRREREAARLREEYSRRAMGVTYDASEQDKYKFEATVEIDCENRVHLCKASCCKLRFSLSAQDVEEGLIRWDLANPYVIAQGADNYCQHLDRKSLNCTAHACRPITCRGYDCREDTRIWLDFERMIVNPRINDPDWPRTIKQQGVNPNDDDEQSDTHLEQIGEQRATAQSPSSNDGSRFAAFVARVLQRVASRPVMFRFRGLRVSGYSLYLSAGLGIATFYMLLLVALRFRRDAPSAWVLVGTVVAAYAGSRLLFELERRLSVWMKQSPVAQRGQSLYGGLLGALVYYAYIYRAETSTLLFYADCAAPAVALGYAIGKLGCLAHGCCVGRPTQARLSVVYRSEETKAAGFYDLKGVRLLPVQAYETTLGLALFVGLSLLPKRAYGTGQVMGALLLALGLARMFLLRFRYRRRDERAASLLSDFVNTLLVALGALLLSKAFVNLAGGASASAVGVETNSLWWQLLLSLAAALVAFAFFGGPSLKTGDS